MADRGTCRSCGASILWAVTEKGHRMPLDAKPEKRFTLHSEGHPDGELARARDTFTSHFATCPNAAQHRKPKGGAHD